MRIAVVDIDVDAVRLLVAQQRPPDLFDDGGLEWLDRRVTVTGGSRSRNGDGLGRAIAVLAGYAEAMRAWAVDRAVAVVSEDVAALPGGAGFAAAAGEALAVPVTLISGAQAEAFSFAGAVAHVDGSLPFLVVHVGPRSTRFALGKHRPDFTASSPHGALSVLEGDREGFPVDTGRLAMARSEARRHVRVEVPEPPGTLVGVGPGFSSLASVALGLPVYDPSAVQGVKLALETVTALVSLLAEMDRDTAREIPGLDGLPGEAMLGAAVIVEQTMRYLGAVEATVSVGDMLDGIVEEVVASPPGPAGPRTA